METGARGFLMPALWARAVHDRFSPKETRDGFRTRAGAIGARRKPAGEIEERASPRRLGARRLDGGGIRAGAGRGGCNRQAAAQGSRFIEVMQDNTPSGTTADGAAYNLSFLPGGEVTYDDSTGARARGRWSMDPEGTCASASRQVALACMVVAGRGRAHSG
jgi:hypothetical protein